MKRQQQVIIAVVIIIALGLVWSLKGKQASAPSSTEPIRIGVLAPLTGDYAVLGNRIKNGMELAKEDILKAKLANAIEIYYEDVCLGKDAVSAIRKLVEVNKIRIIGGSFCLIGLVPVLPIAAEQKLIVFNTAANPDDVLNKKYVFSTNISIKSDAEKLAQYASGSLGAKTAAIIYYDTPFGHDYEKHFSESFKRRGGTIILNDKTPLGTTDFRTQLTKIRASRPDVILAIHDPAALGSLLKQARELKVQTPILSMAEAEDPTILKLAGKAAEGFTISSSEPAAKTEKIKDFERRYQEQFGEKPDPLAANAYDSLWLEVTSYQQCHGNSDCIDQALHQIKNYDGVSGTITINLDGSASKPTIFKTVRNGQFVEVK